jgi:hypothetical protein
MTPEQLRKHLHQGTLEPCDEWFYKAMWMFTNPFASDTGKRLVFKLILEESYK